ncbi:Bet v I/Major latex protein [Trema orientale]|uniref:Bet v I/Major latex protein n=1 Tax=Trema orientale TaxID=63057 RepID=A0A2P5F8A6_TREOI|nr:Bet v I/Major latex protein [Trema orientale]
MMRSLKGEVVLNIPAEKAWEMYRDNKIVSQKPEMLAHAEYIPKEMVEPWKSQAFEAWSRRVLLTRPSERVGRKGEEETLQQIICDLHKMYDPYRVTFSFTPLQGKEQDKCIAEWKAEYEVRNTTMPPPEKARDAALGFLKWFDKFEPSY